MSPVVYSMAGRLSKIDIAEAERVLMALGRNPDYTKDTLRPHIEYNEAIDAMEQIFKRKPYILSSGPSPTDTCESLGEMAKDLYAVHEAIHRHQMWYTYPLPIEKAIQPVFPEHEISYAKQLLLEIHQLQERYRTEPERRAKALAEKNGHYLVLPMTVSMTIPVDGDEEPTESQ